VEAVGKVSRARRVMVLPDRHVPHQDPAALACVLATAAVWDPDEIVVLGDWLDAALFSSHAKLSLAEDCAHGFLASEVGPVNAILDTLQSRGKGRAARPLRYLEGNHEQRIERWAANAGGKLGADLYKLASPRHLIERRVDADGYAHGARKSFTWIPYIGAKCYSHYQIAAGGAECSPLVAIHGWSWGANFAAANMARARNVSVVCGHTHRAQSVTGRDPLTRATIKSWSPGCLAQLVMPYAANAPSDASHGLSLVYVGQHSWTDYTIEITNQGRAILPDGMEVRA
jgi:hypothetical protein